MVKPVYGYGHHATLNLMGQVSGQLVANKNKFSARKVERIKA